MKKVFVTLLALFMIFAFTACDSSVSDPFEGYAKITKDNASVTEITKLIENSSVKGIMSDDNIVVETKANEKISVDRDFGFYNITFKVELPEGSKVPVSDKGTETSRTHAINLSGKGTEVTFDHVTFLNYTHAITVSRGNSVTLTIKSSDFSNCFKGLYAEGLDNLYVDDITMTNMGIGSVASTGSTEAEKQERSGSGFDINQTEEGGVISITNSTFSNCGDPKDKNESNITSGAIKIKVRGGENDAEDYKGFNASFDSVTITGNIFNSDTNRYDVVLGTGSVNTTYPDKLATTNTTIQDCELQDKSGNNWIIKDGKLAKDTATETEQK